jgi:hypothetical protein
MQYSALQLEESDMPKPGMTMSEADVDNFIRKSKDEERMTWDQITDQLAKMGYKSRRNGKPLAVTTVRFRYYNPRGHTGPTPGTTAYSLTAASGNDRTLELIRTTLKAKMDPNSKLALIEQLLDKS